jgi:hypothetical protein
LDQVIMDSDSASHEPPASASAGEPERRKLFPVDLRIAGPVLLFVILIAKTYGAANYSLTTMAALIAATPLSIAIGTIALYAYIFVGLAAVLSAIVFLAGFGHTYRQRCRPMMPYAFVIAVLAALLAPWHYTVDVALCAGVAFLLYRILRLARIRMAPDSFVAAAAMFLLTVFVLATEKTAWLPAQVVTLTAPIVGDPTHSSRSLTRKPVAYVVDDNNGWTTMLLDDDRYVAQVRDSAVLGRRICHLNSQFPGAEPLFGTIFHGKYVPHDLSCWRLTDQLDEKNPAAPPVVIRLLSWEF